MVLGISADVLALLQTHGYWVMFLIMILEGPIVTYVAAFAASLEIFNFYIVLILSILGNVVGDLIYYLIGRFGRKIIVDRYMNFMHLKKERIEKIEKYLKENVGKTITVVKLTPPLPGPGLILAGVVRIPFGKFMFYSVLVSVIFSLFFTLIGFYSGVAFGTMSKYVKYGQFLIGGVVLLIIGFWLLLKLLIPKISRKIEKI